MNKIAEEITITVISTDHEEMAYETISRGVMARLLTVWTVLSKNLTRVICSPGYIRHLTLYMPESIEDMCPERYLLGEMHSFGSPENGRPSEGVQNRGNCTP